MSKIKNRAKSTSIKAKKRSLQSAHIQTTVGAKVWSPTGRSRYGQQIQYPGRRHATIETFYEDGTGRYLKSIGGPGAGPYSWKGQPPSQLCLDFGGFEGWVPASPESEHIESFRFVKKEIFGGEISFLQVKFKWNGGNKPPGLAVYWAVPGTRYTAERLEVVYELMRAAAHPGAYIWSHLIGEGSSVEMAVLVKFLTLKR